MDHLCMSHSALLTTAQLLQSPLTVPKEPLLSHLVFLLLREFLCMQNHSSPSALSFFFHLTRLCEDCSCPFRCPRSSANAQLVLYENGSICKYILDEFVGRDDLYTLLLFHYLDFSKIAVLFKNFILLL